MDYIVHDSVTFNCGFVIEVNDIMQAISNSNDALSQLPSSLYRSIDYKTTSAMIGCILCENIAALTNGAAIVNPIEKGHPDIVPASAINCTEEELRNYPVGLEIKCTVGNVSSGAQIDKAKPRIDYLTGITWQAHHQEVSELLGVTFDYFNTASGYKPAITAAFYSDNLCIEDWGGISGTTGRNTKVCGMTASGRRKMGQGWLAVVRLQKYYEKFNHLFNIHISE